MRNISINLLINKEKKSWPTEKKLSIRVWNRLISIERKWIQLRSIEPKISSIRPIGAMDQEETTILFLVMVACTIFAIIKEAVLVTPSTTLRTLPRSLLNLTRSLQLSIMYQMVPVETVMSFSTTAWRPTTDPATRSSRGTCAPRRRHRWWMPDSRGETTLTEPMLAHTETGNHLNPAARTADFIMSSAPASNASANHHPTRPDLRLIRRRSA